MGPRRYLLPKGMRYSTLRERAAFYRHEFDLSRVLEWVSVLPTRPIYAAVIGRHTRLYPRKYRTVAATTLIIDDYRDAEDLRRLLVELRPESVYYDRNIYRQGKPMGQELAFDLDPENTVCPVHGSLEDKMKRGQGLGFCELELEMVKEATLRLYEDLKGRFSDVKIVYSGRGFHIHIFDREAFEMKRAERRRLSLSLKGRGYPLDAWVTEGSMRLIRLPYSLHGMVSRVVIPLRPEELEDFDPVKDPRCLPSFLGRG